MNTAKLNHQRKLLLLAALSLTTLVNATTAQKLPPAAVCRLEKAKERSWTGVEGTTFSPDGKLVATRSSDHIIRIYEIVSGRLLKALPEVEEGRIEDFTFSHDSRYIFAAINEETTVNVWSVSTGKPLVGSPMPKTYVVHRTATAGQIAFVTKSSMIVRTASEPDKVVGVRALPTSSAKSEPEMVSPDGSQVLLRMFANGGHRLMVVSLQNGPVLPLDGFARSIEHANWSPNGRDIAAFCRDDRRVFFRDVDNREYRVALAQHEAVVQAIAFSPDARHLVSGDKKGNLRVWDMERKQVLCEIKEPPGRRLISLQFSPNGKYLASGSGGKEDNTAIVWDWKKLLLAHIDADKNGKAWELLASKYPKSAYSGIKSLVLDADRSIELFREEFGANKQSLTRDQIALLIKQLNATAFVDRETAYNELSRVRITAADQLREALATGTQPVETEVRLRKLLAVGAETGEFNMTDVRRLLRAVYVLELIDNNEARLLLQSIAKSHPFDAIRKAASNTIERIGPPAIH